MNLRSAGRDGQVTQQVNTPVVQACAKNKSASASMSARRQRSVCYCAMCMATMLQHHAPAMMCETKSSTVCEHCTHRQHTGAVQKCVARTIPTRWCARNNHCTSCAHAASTQQIAARFVLECDFQSGFTLHDSQPHGRRSLLIDVGTDRDKKS